MEAIRTWRTVVPLLIAGLLTASPTRILAAPPPVAKPVRSLSLLKESKANVRMALKYLQNRQQENGSWREDPAMTALVVTAMLGSAEADYALDSQVVKNGLGFIRSCARPDGGIYLRGYANYSTSICVMALIEAGLPEDVPLLKKARAFLLGLQADEGEEFTKDDWQYGGWGYEKHKTQPGMHTADMSNTQLAIEALVRLQEVAEEDKWDAGVGEGEKTASELALAKAVVFLQRCQNRQASNNMPRTGNDGGFRYRPTETRADGQQEGEPLRSYASITYAGVKSLVYANLTRQDPRVQAAFKWVSDRWTVAENPGLGHQSLYYYYMTMARCLNACGVEQVVDAKGKPHDWRTELVQQLLNLQRPDDSWFNENGRWMERIPELVTAYALLAVEQAWTNW